MIEYAGFKIKVSEKVPKGWALLVDEDDNIVGAMPVPEENNNED